MLGLKLVHVSKEASGKIGKVSHIWYDNYNQQFHAEQFLTKNA